MMTMTMTTPSQNQTTWAVQKAGLRGHTQSSCVSAAPGSSLASMAYTDDEPPLSGHTRSALRTGRRAASIMNAR